MPFDPSTIKPRTPSYEKTSADAPREQRVLALAHLLHSRGVTASLADAKRLAEGMVDVERKILKDGAPKAADPSTERERIQSSSPFFAAAGIPQRPSSAATGLGWPADFAHFVERTAAVGKPAAAAAMPRRPEPAVAFGRGEEQHAVASVPHVGRSKLVFFEDAPTLDRTRGFAGETEHKPKFDPFTYGKEDSSLLPFGERVSMRVEQGDAGVMVRSETVTPESVVVAERMVVEVEEPLATAAPTPEPVPAEPVYAPEERPPEAAPEESDELPAGPVPVEEPAPAVEEVPSVDAVEVPPPAAPPVPERKSEDLAKQHGVDLFTMFRVKKD